MFPEKLLSIITAAFALFNLPTHYTPLGLPREKEADKIPKSCSITHSWVGSGY